MPHGQGKILSQLCGLGGTYNQFLSTNISCLQPLQSGNNSRKPARNDFNRVWLLESYQLRVGLQKTCRAYLDISGFKILSEMVIKTNTKSLILGEVDASEDLVDRLVRDTLLLRNLSGLRKG